MWNTGSQLIGRAVSAIATLAITIIIARVYGTDGYGDFVKITTYVGFFYLLADFGFNAIFLQRSQSLDTAGPAWNDLVTMRVVASVILVFLAVAILALMPQGFAQGYTQAVRLGIILFAPTIMFQALITTANALFQKKLRYDLSTLAVVAGSLTSLGLAFVLARFTRIPGIFSIFPLFFGSAVTSLVAMWFVKKYAGSSRIIFSLPRLRSFFLASAPLGLTLLFNVVYFHIDSIVLTLTRSTTEVGIYGLVYKIFELFLVIPTFFMNALYPVLLKAQGEHKEFAMLIRRSALFLSLASLVLIVCIWFGAPYVVLIKKEFLPGVGALRILSFGLPFFFLSSITMWTLIAKKKQIHLMSIYGVSMVINIILNVLLVPVFGYIAAAWITVASEALVLVISVAVTWRAIAY